MPIVFDYNTVYSLAKIDNDNFNISNLKVSLYPGSIGAAQYFIIKNEGVHDVYFDFAGFDSNIYSKVCTAEESEKQTLVDGYCDSILRYFAVTSSTAENLLDEYGYEAFYKIVPNDWVGITFAIGAANDSIENMETGFNVLFDDFKLDFSSVDKYAQYKFCFLGG